MEYTAIFEERVPLTSRDLGKNIESIDDILLDILVDESFYIFRGRASS